MWLLVSFRKDLLAVENTVATPSAIESVVYGTKERSGTRLRNSYIVYGFVPLHMDLDARMIKWPGW